jgi:DNA-binding transcriptional ArsR family regulator
MAFDTLLWVRKQKTGNCASRSVLRVLADHAGQDHSCYLRTRLIASETDLSEGGVRKALARLIEAGLVRIYDRYDRTGKRVSNRYQVLVDGAETPAPDAEDYADVRGLTLNEGEGPLNEGEGQTLNGGEGFPSTEASSSEAPIVKGPASRAMTATRIPENFMPDEKMRAWFADEKLAAVIDGVTEHAKFVDYFAGAPGVKGRKVDWPATWRNWMRTAAERAGRRPGPGNALVPTSGAPYRPSTTDQRVGQALDIARKYEEQGL